MFRLLSSLLFIIAMSGPVLAATIEKCPAPKGMPSVNHPDERVRAVFSAVVEKSGLKGNFALCQHPYYRPLAAPVFTKDRRMITVVSLPRYISRFSGDELEGTFAHELGHVPGFAHPLSGIPNEKRADAVGSGWVGTDKMISFLTAMKRSLKEFPASMRGPARGELAARMRTLVDPILVVESRT